MDGLARGERFPVAAMTEQQGEALVLGVNGLQASADLLLAAAHGLFFVLLCVLFFVVVSAVRRV